MKIQTDKWRHFFVGIVMGLVLEALAGWFLHSHKFLGALIALIVIISISYGFELFSKFTGKGTYDVMDAVASVLGGLLGMAVIAIL